jgi:hypothetical protein
MNCPVCKIKNDLKEEFCIQCKSNLVVHRLMLALKEGVLMTHEELSVMKQPSKLIKIILILQSLTSILIMFFIVFSIVLEVKWLAFFKHQELHYLESSSKSEIASKQLQQMFDLIAQQLELVKAERIENQALKEKLTIEKVVDEEDESNQN